MSDTKKILIMTVEPTCDCSLLFCRDGMKELSISYYNSTEIRFNLEMIS